MFEFKSSSPLHALLISQANREYEQETRASKDITAATYTSQPNWTSQGFDSVPLEINKNTMQDETDPFFGAINSTTQSQEGTTGLGINASSSSSPASQDQVQQTQFPVTDTTTFSPSPQQQPQPHLQPGMSPAIQKGPVSLGLALGGSGFRRKPLFGPEDEDEEHGEDEEFRGLGDTHSSFIDSKTKKKKGQKDATFEELTRSEFDGEARRAEYEDEDEEDEDDADSETPLQPQEPIRGLE